MSDSRAQPEQSSEEAESSSERIQLVLAEEDLFAREQPAILEGPADSWAAARTAIDFGGAMLRYADPVRPDRELRDAVTLAILRRALITAEGVWWLLSRGLEETAAAASRTLMDIEINLRLVLRDPSDVMATRFAAFHYLGSQRHGQKLLKNRETRESISWVYGSPEETVQITRSFAKLLEAPIFDDVRESVQAGQHWHGYANVRDAFEAVGEGITYHTVYSSASFYVHDTNVDRDFSELDEDGLHLRPLVQRDPTIVQVHLGEMTLRLYTILELIISDTGLPRVLREQQDATPAQADVAFSLHGIEALRALLLQHFQRGPAHSA